jgi:hypothetical protein
MRVETSGRQLKVEQSMCDRCGWRTEDGAAGAESRIVPGNESERGLVRLVFAERLECRNLHATTGCISEKTVTMRSSSVPTKRRVAQCVQDDNERFGARQKSQQRFHNMQLQVSTGPAAA